MTVPTKPKPRRGVPLHEVVKGDILELIRKRGLTGGERIPQIRELAKLYGVSYVTASRAVSQLVDSGVLSSRVGDGTYVEEDAVVPAATLANHTIAAVLRDVYQLDLYNLGASIRTIGAFSNQHGLKMQMIIVHEDESSIGVESLIQEATDQKVEGLIITSRVDPRLIIRLKKEGIPFVWIGDELPHHETYSVLGSRVGGALAGIRTLRELGQKKVGVLHDPFITAAAEATRIDASARGATFDPSLVITCPRGQRDAVRDATEKLLSAGCDALFCADEQATGWSQERAIELGRKLPQDVVYATFAPPAPDYQTPAPFVGLSAPMEKMAEEACKLLMKLIEGEEQPTYQRVFDLQVTVPRQIRER